MLLHEHFVATFVLVATIATATAALHAVAELGRARNAGPAQGAELVVATLFVALAEEIGGGDREKADADRFVGAGVVVTTEDGAVTPGRAGVADAVA